MARAIELAGRGRGATWPNPLVGCVLVSDGLVVGEGWHERLGGPHAEANALEAAGERTRGATAYVTLEPCAHQGRTPPCADALIAAGVARVVVGMRDPNPVAAGGLERLQRAGLEVEVGLLADEVARQNEVFLTVTRRRRPFVFYKTAMTLDGKIATGSGESRWITGERSRARVHRWRSEADAIAVGINTVLADDPFLTCRLPGARSPVKMIFDSAARTPPAARLFDPDPGGKAAEVIIYTTETAPQSRVEALKRRAQVVVVPARSGRPDVAAALADALERGIHIILLEGGGGLAWSFIEQQAVDRGADFIAPMLRGGRGPRPLGGSGVRQIDDAARLGGLETEIVEGDVLITGRVEYGKTESAVVVEEASS